MKQMKLRNKKTGDIKELLDVINTLDNGKDTFTLAELNEDWEDVPEDPKEYWYISAYGNLAKTDVMTDLHRGAEEIGNLFSTKEEAEEAVEKLKALKRLKDKGFRFVGWRGDMDKHHLDGVAWYEMRLCGGYDIETADDLETIFGPEEKE